MLVIRGAEERLSQMFADGEVPGFIHLSIGQEATAVGVAAALIDGDTLITKALDDSFLHGITRDSILTLARDLGMTVEERQLSVDELLERSQKPGCEAALSGTAAVLTPVATLLHKGQEYRLQTRASISVTVSQKQCRCVVTSMG